MSKYLLINILIILFPLALTFEKKIQYYKKLPSVFSSIIIVGSVYVLWDVLAAYRGDWSFNSQFISGGKIFNLPFEEILFFITVPYSGLFLYETAKYYLTEKKIEISERLLFGLSAILIFTAVANSDKYYTFTVLLFSAGFILLNIFSRSSVIKSKIYWLWIAFMFIPFLIVNYILTSLPVVIYSSEAILGARFLTIPIEDFFYSFSMLSFNLFVYLITDKKWQAKRK